MSSLLKVYLVFTGNYKDVEKYIEDDFVGILRDLFVDNTDIPYVNLYTDDNNFIMSSVDDELIDKKFSSRDYLSKFIEGVEFSSFGKVPSIDDILGLYSLEDRMNIGVNLSDDIDLHIISNPRCKDFTVPSTADYCIVVDSRNPDLKLNINLFQKLLKECKCCVDVYSEFDEQELKNILPNLDINCLKI